jgi:plastocyanin
MRHVKSFALAAAWLALAPFASAGTLAVQVTDQAGHPVEDAVVTVVGTAAPAARIAPATRIDPAHTVDQKSLAFMPFVDVLRPGDSVVFHNSDATQHHVYSFSPVKAFEFVVAPGTRSAPLVFDKTGVVAVGCNIHDGMISYLYITDAPFAARTDARGRVAFDDLPAGTYDVRVWQPRLPPGRPDLRQKAITITGTEDTALAFPLTLRPDPRRQFDREHTHY